MTQPSTPAFDPGSDPALDIVRAYRARAGASDELLDAAGAVRPVWRSFLEHFARLGPDDVARRFAHGDQYLRDAGVFFRQYDASGSTERAWPLSHVPVIIDDTEWRGIEAGLIQRAELLEAVLADLYGEARLVRDGYLPAELIAASPEWLRPLVGVAPPSGHYLHFLAFEIGRGPDGGWWVLADRAQAPSGAGFALENRVAASRVFADYFFDAPVRRLGGFFRDFSDALQDLRPDGEGQVALLTPGPMNETYFEHAYIARHMGLALVEGEDLAVRAGRLYVRTVSGPHPVSVIWRRIDSSYADPLELDDTSQLGAAGLIGAVRSGHLTLVNALGSGILETRALLAFLPRICEALRGEPLLTPNIATWWCGQSAERDHVVAHAEQMVLSPALSTALLFDPDATLARDEDPAALAARVARDGRALVGQEAVTLSTTPAYVDGALRPRPMSLRVFLARTPEGWRVMPGGYARIGRSEDAAAVSMQRGGLVADVWVTADAPSPEDSIPASATTGRPSALANTLPSRSADNLYWLGRYIERAEGMIRLLRAHHHRLAENVRSDAPLATSVREFRKLIGLEQTTGAPPALTGSLAAANACASRVRDRISIDAWTALGDLVKTADQVSNALDGDDAARAMSVLLRKITGIAGLVHENMYRFTDWRFITIGRALERALTTASALAWFADPVAPDGALDFALELGDSSSAHRRRYATAPTRVSVLELLAFDTRNPRSTRYQLGEIRREATALPGAEDRGLLAPPLRAMVAAETSLAVATPGELTTEALFKLQGDLAEFSDLLADAYLR
ncbi:MAG: circularly permuted type 2 ATP-grasp protein [Maricaulaceae bacterium]|jgi:uncharacterized circularly permuted ATP-grasp superfamily protein/uncharacterized alpha-E superfamily protein